MKIIMASGNKGKIAEVCRFFPKVEIITPKELPGFIEPEENGRTFEENSAIKARALYHFFHEHMTDEDIILADDSGIIVPILGLERLGVYTKRQMVSWCTQFGASEIEFWNHIVDEAGEKEKAEFVAAITVIDSEGREFIFKHILTGTTAYGKGKNGFGFDPIFEVDGKTLAEYTSEEKQKMSPRAKALEKVKKQFSK